MFSSWTNFTSTSVSSRPVWIHFIEFILWRKSRFFQEIKSPQFRTYPTRISKYFHTFTVVFFFIFLSINLYIFSQVWEHENTFAIKIFFFFENWGVRFGVWTEWFRSLKERIRYKSMILSSDDEEDGLENLTNSLFFFYSFKNSRVFLYPYFISIHKNI